jgi:hypothetical protein
MYICIHVKYPLFLSDFNKAWIFSTDFREKKISNIKFHQNPSSESRVIPSGQRERERERYDEANNSFSHFCESVLKIRYHLRSNEQKSARQQCGSQVTPELQIVCTELPWCHFSGTKKSEMVPWLLENPCSPACYIHVLIQMFPLRQFPRHDGTSRSVW